MSFELSTARFKLRDVVKEDLGDLIVAYNDAEVLKYLCYPSFPLRDEEVIEYITRWEKEQSADPRTDFNLGIELKGKVIGLVSLSAVDRTPGVATLSYSLGRPYWGSGIATEVARRVIDFGFSDLDLRRIDAETSPNNLRSQKVLEKLGFSQEGLRKKHRVMSTGEVHDLIIYGLLKQAKNVVS